MDIARVTVALFLSVVCCFAMEEWERLADQAEKLLYEDRNLDEAIAVYGKAIALEPGNPSLYGNRGNAYSYQNKIDLAMTDYDKAIELAVAKLGSENAKPLCYFYYNKAYAYDRADRHAEAIPYYEKVVSIDPDYPDAHGHLAWILAASYDKSLRNPERAIALAKHELKRLAGKDADVMDTLAAAYAASGNFKEATAWQKKAIDASESASAKKEFSERLILYQQEKPYFQPK